MIPLFDLQNNKPVPSIHCHIVPWLKEIMTLFPDDYMDIYAYLFYSTCPDKTMNIYWNQPEATRESVILADLKPKFYLEDMKILQAKKRCEEMYDTATKRLCMSAKRALEKVAQFLDDNEITEGKDGTGTLFNTMMSKLSDYNKQFKDLEQEMEKEQATVRGGTKIPYHQRPGYMDTKEDNNE